MSYNIRELESLSGIRAHTIRIWEQRYHFLKPSRTVTNIRTYSNDELKTLLTVALLNKYGYKISKIDGMDPEARANAVLRLNAPEAKLEKLVNEMIGLMIDLDSRGFEELLDNQIAENGLEETITGIIFYFLEKLGILWQTGKIYPVQEHIVSNIIRQKIITAIEGLPPVKTNKPQFLLFLPEDEHHEMGLLFVYYLLKKKEQPVIYLGANVPVKDVRYLAEIKKPAYFYIHLTSFPRQHNFQKFLKELSQHTNSATALISGSAAQDYKMSLPPGIQLFKTFTEAKDYINRVTSSQDIHTS